MSSRASLGSPRATSRRPRAARASMPRVVWVASLLAAVGAVTAAFPADPASASITSITTRPELPTLCDPVGLVVKGTMPDPCYHLIGATIRGPVELPTMGPIPTYEIRIRLTVQEPNPDLDIACPTVLQPYEHGFRLGILPSFGRYFVRATEYLVPFSPDSSGFPKDSTTFEYVFDVPPPTASCPPGPDCFILDFRPAEPVTTDPTRVVCDARGRPGGTGCFDVSLMTAGRVGGVQAQVTIRRATEREPVAPEILHPTSVEAVGRAASFQVAWSAEGSVLRVLLYSPTGGVLEPGDGPILHVCYAIGERAPAERYAMHFTEAIVADPSGVALDHCPTFAEIIGTFCVEGERSCDLNSDGISDIRDIVLLVRCALSGGIGGTVDCPDPLAGHADCNRDGSVDVRDVICCVRNVLEVAGLAYQTMPASRPPDDPTITDIRFQGPVQWTSASSGWAVLEVRPGIDAAGIQFGVGSETRGVRVRGLTLMEAGDGVAFDWTTRESQDCAVKGILYRPAGDTRLRGPIRVRVEVEATGETGGFPYLSVILQAANVDGSGSRTTSGLGAIPTASGTAPSVTAAAPNPFVFETQVTYALPADGRVTLRIYTTAGRLVRTLVDASLPAGVRHARWDGKDAAGNPVASGVYFLKFSAGTVERTQRILRLR